MIDDTLPEEQEEQHKELIVLLHQAYQQSFAPAADAQAQALERVGKRLATLEDDIAFSSSHEMLPEPLLLEQALLQGPEMMRDKSGRKKRVMHFINMLAAVLMVGLLVSGAVALFIQRAQSTPAGPVGAPVTTRVEAGGLEMTLSVTPGPYFLSELVFAKMSLTNHTHTTFTLFGIQQSTPCMPALYLSQKGGESPHYAIPLSIFGFSCPHIGTNPLKPDQTITIQQYESLNSSGPVTLTAQARSMRNDASAPSPLEGRWPSMQIQVASRIPSDRHLSLHQKGLQVTVDAPPTVHLVYQFRGICDGDSTASITWEPVLTHVLNGPGDVMGCSSKDFTNWQYVIGAPGYAIAAGKYPA